MTQFIRPFILLLCFLFLISCKSSDDAPEVIVTKEDWYTVTQLNQDTWALEERKSSQGNVSYVIAGTDRVIMFDSGTGENSGQGGSKVMYQIKEITNLPITLLLSHFHFDHNQNVHEFDHIAFPKLPYLVETVNSEDNYFISEAELFEGSRPSSIHVDEWLSVNEEIDLGDRKIQIISVPGHTKESIAVIDFNQKMAFMGDFLYNGALFVFNSNDMRTYLRSMDRMIELIEDDYLILGAHGRPSVSYQSLLNSHELLRCIVQSDCFTEENISVFGKEAILYRSLDQSASLVLVLPN